MPLSPLLTLVFVSVNTSLCFGAGDVPAGERVRLQVVISSAAQPDTQPVEFSSMVIHFNGYPSLVLSDNGQISPTRESEVIETVVQEPHSHDTSFAATANLTMYPGQTRVFNMSLPMREPGEVQAHEISLHIQKPNFSVSYTKALTSPTEVYRWYSMRHGIGLVKQRQTRDAGSVRVLPKQPKMVLHVPHLRATYFGGERAVVSFTVVSLAC